MEAKVGKTYLTNIPHKKGSLTFQYPALKGYFWNVAEAIDEEGLKRPSSSETASLVYDAFQNLNGKYESEIKGILKNNCLFEFTGNLYIPKSNEEVNDGVILDLNPTISDRGLIMNKSSLIEKLRSNDPLVKFVPRGFKTGEQTSRDLEKNLYLIERYGEEEAQKISEVASYHKKQPFLNVLNSVNEETVRMSALDDDYWGFDDRLCVCGISWIGDDRGHAFPVVPDKLSCN